MITLKLDKLLKLIRSMDQAHWELFQRYNQQETFNKVLDTILLVTNSEYGFIGEIISHEEDMALKIAAITDLSWDENTKKIYDQLSKNNMIFRNLDNLFGEVIKNKIPIISNDPTNDDRSKGLPNGHPQLNSFLGIPFFSADNTLIGMIGLANKESGYGQDDINNLEIILETLANLILVSKAINERIESENNAKRNVEFTQSVLNTTVDAIITINTKGIVRSFNSAASKIFGYDAPEVIGRNVKMLMPEPNHSAHNGYLKSYLTTKQRKVIGIGREVVGKKKDGSTFSLELSVSEVKVNDEIFFTGICRDVTERKNFEQKLILAKDEAQKASEHKSIFLANMSHEMRTPLNAIQGITHLLSETELTDKQKEYVNIFQTASETLLEVINNLLDLSKIESGKLEFTNENFNLFELVNNCINIFSVKSKEKGLELDLDYQLEKETNYHGDALRIKQILNNLLGNAIKFTEKGSIKLKIEKNNLDKNGNMLITVSDEGIGLSDSQKIKVFDEFIQADSSTTRKYGGTGLGLSICKVLAQMFKGEIWIEDNNPQGCQFRFTLELPEQTENTEPKTDTIKSDQVVLNIPTNLNILVVDDYEYNRYVFKAFLQESHPNIAEVENGIKALEVYKNNHNFDIIFMDIQMPEMDGHETSLEIRKHEKDNNLKETPIIALSAHSFKEDINKSLASGCQDHLPKPFNKEQLLETIIKNINR